MKGTLACIIVMALVVLLPQPSEARQRGATVRSDILPSDPANPGSVTVRHTRFDWGDFAHATVEIVTYASYDAAQQAALSFASSSCRPGMDRILLSGSLFPEAQRHNCTPSSYCFLGPNGKRIPASNSSPWDGPAPRCFNG